MRQFNKWNGGTVERLARVWVRARIREKDYTRACVRENSYRSTVPPFQRDIFSHIFNMLGVERQWNGGWCNRSGLANAIKNRGDIR